MLPRIRRTPATAATGIPLEPLATRRHRQFAEAVSWSGVRRCCLLDHISSNCRCATRQFAPSSRRGDTSDITLMDERGSSAKRSDLLVASAFVIDQAAGSSANFSVVRCAVQLTTSVVWSTPAGTDDNFRRASFQWLRRNSSAILWGDRRYALNSAFLFSRRPMLTAGKMGMFCPLQTLLPSV